MLGVSQGTAVLRFGSNEAAARARKRMENEDVFGRSISLSFSPRPRNDASPEPELQSRPHQLPQPMTLPHTNHSQDSMFGPPPSISSFSFLPLEKPRSPRRPRRATRPGNAPGPEPERPFSPRRGCSGPPGGAPAKPHQVSRLVSACFLLTCVAVYPCLGCYVNSPNPAPPASVPVNAALTNCS